MRKVRKVAKKMLASEDYSRLYISHNFFSYKKQSFLVRNIGGRYEGVKIQLEKLLELHKNRGLEKYATFFWLDVFSTHKKVNNNQELIRKFLELGIESSKVGSVPAYVFEKEVGILVNPKFAQRYILDTLKLGISSAQKGWKAESALYWLSALLNHRNVSKNEVVLLINIGLKSVVNNWKPESFYYYLFLLLNNKNVKQRHTPEIIDLLATSFGKKIDYYSLFHWMRVLLHEISDNSKTSPIIHHFKESLKDDKKPFECYKSVFNKIPFLR